MGRNYDDDYGFASEDIFAAAIDAAELAEVLRSPDFDEPNDWDAQLRDSDFELDGALTD